MPPKRGVKVVAFAEEAAAGTSKKRKVSGSEFEPKEAPVEEGRKTRRGVKATKEGEESAAATATELASKDLAPNGQPTNKTLPAHIEFPKKGPGVTRISSWNVSGLAAALKKGFHRYIEAEDCDILILTETKVNEEQNIPVLSQRYPYRYWSISDQKGYGGTAIFSKFEPIMVSKSIPGHPATNSVSGRIVTLEFKEFYLIGTYVTNAGAGLKNMEDKENFLKYMDMYMRELDAKKPLIWGGDMNVALTEIDLANPKANWNKSAGYTELEVKGLLRILDPSSKAEDATENATETEEEKEEEEEDKGKANKKFVDIWRKLHPNLRHYTYFGYRQNCRQKGIGWRLDYFIQSERLDEKVKMCEIRDTIYGVSDHCPIVLEVEGLM